MKIFIIDPEHGVADSGVVGKSLQERDLTLDISKRIADIPQEQYSDIET